MMQYPINVDENVVREPYSTPLGLGIFAAYVLMIFDPIRGRLY